MLHNNFISAVSHLCQLLCDLQVSNLKLFVLSLYCSQRCIPTMVDNKVVSYYWQHGSCVLILSEVTQDANL